ncbi:solute carrier family 22 member 5-like [Parambassis ranga]|uniref:Solute carrier family 22 member 5-like n=1 Tax=Parambassis ranga TaxID=210632 RepID=A0A6P7H3V4_9TELE|nr:solute carrier family 22 member 5-like [Parambassis ranga]
MQDYEASVSFLGTWGPFQRRVFFLLCVTCIPCGYNILSVIFLLASPPHHCHIPTHSNLSQQWIQASIPVQVVSGQPDRSSCSRYDLDLLQNLSALGLRPSLGLIQNQSALGSGPEVNLSSLKQEGCKDGWTYSTEYYQHTVVTEFNLVCSDQWKQPLTSLAYFLGGLCGCFFSGLISDRFGRKPVLFGTIALLSIFSSAVAFAPSWPVFILLFFMLGLGQIACYIVMFVLGSEILIGSSRVLFSSLGLPIAYVFGMLLLPCTAYLVSSWRQLALIMAVPGLACFPLWRLIPESPRWLVSRGRMQEADHLLRSAALENRVDAPPVIFPSATVEKSESHEVESFGFLDLLRTTNIRRITLILWLIWFSMSISYFGVSFNLSSVSGSPFLNYFLLAAVELPASVASWLVACSLPRYLSFIAFSLLGTVALLLIQVTLHNHPAITLFLVLLGKFGVMAGNGVLYIYTGELSPTVIRTTAMSSCTMFSRVGSSLSPYLLQLAVFYPFLPWTIVSCLSLLSVLFCIFLPETFRQPLLDTIHQMPPTRQFRWPWASVPPPKDDGKSVKDQTTVPEIICTSNL